MGYTKTKAYINNQIIKYNHFLQNPFNLSQSCRQYYKHNER